MPLTVMTRNLYLGTDVDRTVHAVTAAQAEGRAPHELLLALGHGTHLNREIADRTDFRVRAQLLADEVERTMPDLVGLQEVALVRSGPLELDQVGVPNATVVDYDYLRLLLDALTSRGLDYRAVQVGQRADVEAPAFEGSPFDGTLEHARDVRITMRDVILMRVDTGLTVTDAGDHVFEHNLRLEIAGVAMGFGRGYGWVDVRVGATEVRFVNCHLEAFSADLALAQAGELLAALPADRTTVLVCDANSDPFDDVVKPSDHVPGKAAYELITGPGGFTDEWLEWAPAAEGWTSGLSETVDDPTAAGFGRRIDMVFARTPRGDGLVVEKGEVTGTSVADRDPATGLWPSDHGGVVLQLGL